MRKEIRALRVQVKELERHVSGHENDVSRLKHKIELMASKRFSLPPLPSLGETSTAPAESFDIGYEATISQVAIAILDRNRPLRCRARPLVAQCDVH
jgi:hypothetical protein